MQEGSSQSHNSISFSSTIIFHFPNSVYLYVVSSPHYYIPHVAKDNWMLLLVQEVLYITHKVFISHILFSVMSSNSNLCFRCCVIIDNNNIDIPWFELINFNGHHDIGVYIICHNLFTNAGFLATKCHGHCLIFACCMCIDW